MDEFNHFQEIADQFPKAVSRVVRKTAFDIQAKAASKAPVDTGFLRNSIYVTGTGFNTYGRGVQKAGKLPTTGFVSRRRLQSYGKRVARQRKQEAMLFDELPPPPDSIMAYVAVGAAYGEYVEYGTTRMAARPYFWPAVESVRPSFEAALAALSAKMGSNMSAQLDEL